MTRTTSRLLFLVFASALGLFGCRGSIVGDPCVPEIVPEEGFQAGEVFLETSSVQCRTRTCLVFQPEDAAPLVPDQLTDDELIERVYCSCRCAPLAGTDTNTPTCDCPSGFDCVEGIVTQGGDGLTGGYCIRRFDGDGLPDA
ncbi:MAG: hypothetical protein AAGH15_26885 [Myxococcota bacterium]